MTKCHAILSLHSRSIRGVLVYSWGSQPSHLIFQGNRKGEPGGKGTSRGKKTNKTGKQMSLTEDEELYLGLQGYL